MRSAKDWLNILLIIIGLLHSASARPQTAVELEAEILDALDTMCSVFDLANAVKDKFMAIGDALEGIPSSFETMTPGQRGRAGEDTVRELLDEADIDYFEQVRHEGAETGSGRRGDFVISKGDAHVNVEVKNVAELRRKEVAQILDYPPFDRTIVAVRSGAKIERELAQELLKYSNRITVVECAFYVM